MSKNFIEEIKKFEQKLRFGDSFALTRFSDGEVMILADWNLELGEQIKFGPNSNIRTHNHRYPPEDHKKYNPKKDSWFKDKLLEAFLYEQDGYYKGIHTGKDELYDLQFDLLNKTKEEVTIDKQYTFSDVFVNGNYPYFLEHILPYFFNYEVVMICNENAHFKKMPFKIKKDFRVGYNCIINNYDIIEKIRKWIDEHNIENHLFLFSASALSETAIHQLYKHNDKNTYLDIGTCLNIFMNITIDRNYLRGFWLNSGEPDIRRINEW